MEISYRVKRDGRKYDLNIFSMPVDFSGTYNAEGLREASGSVNIFVVRISVRGLKRGVARGLHYARERAVRSWSGYWHWNSLMWSDASGGIQHIRKWSGLNLSAREQRWCGFRGIRARIVYIVGNCGGFALQGN